MDRKRKNEATDHDLNTQNRLAQALKTRAYNIKLRKQAHELLNSYEQDYPFLRLICECGQADCSVLLDVPYIDRVNIRTAYKDSFIIHPDHLDPLHDKVLRENEAYLIIKKSLNQKRPS